MIQFEMRSYTSGKVFRPKALHWTREESQLQVIVTPWGSAEYAEGLWKRLYEVFEGPESAAQNVYTNPLQTETANRLAFALRTVHSEIYQSENLKQLRMGFEVLVLQESHGFVHFARAGQPHIVLVRAGQIQPISYEPDWSWHHGQAAPLPTNAIGMESNVQIHTGSFSVDRNTQLVLVSRGALPSKFFANEKQDLKSYSRLLIEADSVSPFWLAVGST